MKTLLLKIVDSLRLYPLFNRYTKNTATIFMLHSITPRNEYRDGAISEMTLRRLLGYLMEHRYNVISLKSYIDALINHKETFKTAVFTVDDGYQDFYLNAYPVFREYGFPATIFLTSDFIENRLFFWWDTIEFTVNMTSFKEIDLESSMLGKIPIGNSHEKQRAISLITQYCKSLPDQDKLELIRKMVATLQVDISCQPQGIYEPLKWDEIREMKAHKIDFHPHTKTHPILSKTTYSQKLVELTEPKNIIESRLGTGANIFCYPNGLLEDFDEETISILKSTGHIAAVTGVDGFDSTMDSVEHFRLHRFVMPSEDMIFKQYVSGLEFLKRRFIGR